MEHEILYRPSYSLLRVNLRQGESIAAEAGAMVSMSSGIEIETRARGGVFGALKRSVLGGESFFINTFHANQPVDYGVERVGGLKSTFFSGEGLVCRLTGPGRILIQTRSPDAFLAWLIPQIPRKE